HTHLGTKTSSRRLFAEVGIPHPAGRNGVRTKEEVADAICHMRRADPDMGAVVVKHDEGVSGFGNAIVELAGLP
ncbi:MAG: hypothetical protein GWN85_20100, partial [Gemmatimonadetes bacterium]|nr:hypothetical protein [Gemmatimonadota bacterium]NIR37976.1 hypothetical protein [Actinomycetota bacterium]NIS32535.1 hypothetical protein [Actinomycetota bacterium]NIU67553.1 hypothetical protein [Actinomycetota bacterium]NIW29313.1 hypothetical protein [Actinomycetota bacterium]